MRAAAVLVAAAIAACTRAQVVATAPLDAPPLDDAPEAAVTPDAPDDDGATLPLDAPDGTDVTAATRVTRAGYFTAQPWLRAARVDAVGDFDGDGVDDVAWLDRARGAVVVAAANLAASAVVSEAEGFFAPRAWPGLDAAWFEAGVQLSAGDLDGDRRADLVAWRPGDAVARVALAAEGSFVPRSSPVATPGARRVLVGDLDGDLRAEVLWESVEGADSVVSAARFDAPCIGGCERLREPAWPDADVSARDMDGDLRDDLVLVHRATGDVEVIRAYAAGLHCAGADAACRASRVWARGVCAGARCLAADLTGDGQGDLVRLDDAGAVSLMESQGRGLTAVQGPWQSAAARPCAGDARCLAGDFDGNRADDLLGVVGGGDVGVRVALSGGGRDLACDGARCEGVATLTATGRIDTGVPMSALRDRAFTLAARVWTTHPRSVWGAAFASGGSDGIFFFGRARDASEAHLRASAALPATWFFRGVGGAALTPRVWRHLAVTATPQPTGSVDCAEPTRPCTRFEVYVDGARVGRQSARAGLMDGSGSLLLGGIGYRAIPPLGDPNALHGMLDDVSVWARALLPAEVAALAVGAPVAADDRLLSLGFDGDAPVEDGRVLRWVGRGAARRSVASRAVADGAYEVGVGDSFDAARDGYALPVDGAIRVAAGFESNGAVAGDAHIAERAFSLTLLRDAPGFTYGTRVRAMAPGEVVFVRYDSLEASTPTGLRPVPRATACTGAVPNGAISGLTYLPNMVVLRHGPEEYSIYEHLQPFSVPAAVIAKLRCARDPRCPRAASLVNAGEELGLVGRTGRSEAGLVVRVAYQPEFGTLRGVFQDGATPNNATVLGEGGPGVGGFSRTIAGTCGTLPSVLPLTFTTRPFRFRGVERQVSAGVWAAAERVVPATGMVLRNAP